MIKMISYIFVFLLAHEYNKKKKTQDNLYRNERCA